MNKDLNTALYEKMAAEQDKYRDWLKSQPPEEILRHTYEYTIREDIMMAMEELELPDAQAKALLASPSPLADAYREFEKRETGYMDVVRDSIESRAEAALDAQRELPVYLHTAAYAREHGELDQYRTSQRANIACKEAIEAAISENYRDNRLNGAAVSQVTEQFGYDRMLYVLANTVQQKEWDGRFSRANKAWAGTVEVPLNPDSFGGERNQEFVVDSHPGLTDLFPADAGGHPGRGRTAAAGASGAGCAQQSQRHPLHGSVLRGFHAAGQLQRHGSGHGGAAVSFNGLLRPERPQGAFCPDSQRRGPQKGAASAPPLGPPPVETGTALCREKC